MAADWMDTVLTQEQRTQFDVFGFAILRDFLTAAEIAVAEREFAGGLARAEAATRQRGIRRQFNWSNLGAESPFLGGLLEDRRFFGSAEQLFTGEAIGHYANGNSFAGDRTEWHPDTADLSRRTDPKSRSIRALRDPVPAGRGSALRPPAGSRAECRADGGHPRADVPGEAIRIPALSRLAKELS
jgi:hypothetical protein